MKERIMEALQIPKELFSDTPKLTWIGKDDLTCENCGGLLTCTDSTVRFNTAIGILTVTGRELYIKALTESLVVIGGALGGICLE